MAKSVPKLHLEAGMLEVAGLEQMCLAEHVADIGGRQQLAKLHLTPKLQPRDLTRRLWV